MTDQSAVAKPSGSATNATSQDQEERLIECKGVRIPHDTSVLSRKIIKLLSEETYERKEVAAAQRLLQSNDRVIELGAGIGFMSSFAGLICNEGEVHTFEANPHLLPFIRKVHAINGLTNVNVNHAILGAQPGTCTFYVRKNLLASSMDPMDGADIVTETLVEVRDAATEMKRIRPTVLICDIEGAELSVIPMLDLSSLRLAILEIHPQWIGLDGVNTIFQTFMDAGFGYQARGSEGKVVCFRRVE